MRHVMIGASFASLAATKAILSVESDDEITVLSEEKDKPYYRPLISYLLMGKTSEEKMRMEFPERVRVVTGERAERIDTERKEVIAAGGKRYKYDRLLISTGSRPFVPPFEGLEKVDDKIKTTFMTLADARKLDRLLSKKKSALIIGAGLIGLKCAEGIRERVKSLDVVDLAPRILPAVLDEKASKIVQGELETHGISFHLGTSVASFEANEATLQNGEKIPFEILVLAVGVRPNTELFKEIGGKVGKGIEIDALSRTNILDIWAAGDATEINDISSSLTRPLQIVPNASLEGQAAGFNMVGSTHLFDNAIPMNATHFFDYPLITAGSYSGEELDLSSDMGIRRFFIENDHLKGYILSGSETDRAGIYTSLIRDQVRLSTLDEGIFRTPGLMAFPAESRRHMQKDTPR